MSKLIPPREFEERKNFVFDAIFKDRPALSKEERGYGQKAIKEIPQRLMPSSFGFGRYSMEVSLAF